MSSVFFFLSLHRCYKSTRFFKVSRRPREHVVFMFVSLGVDLVKRANLQISQNCLDLINLGAVVAKISNSCVYVNGYFVDE